MALKIILIVLAVLIFLVIGPMFVIQLVVAKKLYELYLVRNDKEPWGRELHPVSPDEEIMAKECYAFEKQYHDLKKEVSITSDGFKLVGEYYDFGHQRTCIIVAGRSEALNYCFYFAKPYIESGFNILAIDNRSHGFSEGKYNSLGLKEYRDILNWAKLLHDEFHNELVIGHGICIGSATLLYAETDVNCPSYFNGLIADGMYVNFPESFKNHAYEAGYPAHFVTEFFFMIFKHHTKENGYYGPIKIIDKMTKPMLFLYSKEDTYSRPDKGQILFDKCGSPKKQLQWFDHGSHSHIRVTTPEFYDQAIKDFLNKNYNY